MAIMTHTEFHLSRLMVTLIFGIWASSRTTEKVGLIGVNTNDANIKDAVFFHGVLTLFKYA